MIDGRLFWDKEIVDDMVLQKLSGGKIIETFPGLSENLYEALKRTAGIYPEKTAIWDDSRKGYTYQEFLDKTEELAEYLYMEKAVKKGTCVGIMMHNTMEFCVTFFALSKLGAIAVLFPSKFKQSEITLLAEHVEVEMIICDQSFLYLFENLNKKQRILAVPEIPGEFAYYRLYESRAGNRKKAGNLSEGKKEDGAVILFTSGTSAMSKSVLLKNYNLMHAVEAYRRTLHITEKDISVIATPIYHVTGIIALLGLFVTAGGTLYLHKLFDARRVVEEARQFGFTFIHASPTVFNLLIREGEGTPKIESLTSFACGSSNMAKANLERLHKWLPDSRFHTVYGLTETSSPATIFPGDAASSKYIGSSGLPIPGLKVKIVDENREEVPNGEIGEVALKGTNVLDGYFRQKTKAYQDGWLYTGDIGYLNQDYYLYIVDRKKDMINRGGEKIWCYDVENEIVAMEGIEDAAVVAIPDSLYGEVPAAMIHLAEERSLTEKQIQSYLRKRIAKYKIPVKIKMAESIPQTPNGKPDKRKIREILMED